MNYADKKIPDTSNLAKKKTDLDAKVTEIERKIPNITGLATNSALVAIENKIPDVCSLVKKTDLNAKITDIANEIPSITDLATNSALTAVENKILDVSRLAKKNKTKQIMMQKY